MHNPRLCKIVLQTEFQRSLSSSFFARKALPAVPIGRLEKVKFSSVITDGSPPQMVYHNISKTLILRIKYGSNSGGDNTSGWIFWWRLSPALRTADFLGDIVVQPTPLLANSAFDR